MAKFNSVLGAHRGSLTAQTQRDDVERVERGRELKLYRSLVKELARNYAASGEDIKNAVANQLPRRQRPLLNTLVTLQQKSGGCEAGSTACSEAADKIEGLLRTRRQDVLDTTELLAVAITGDPNFYPGLSAPAIEALGRFFAHSHGTKSFGKMVALAIWECLPESKATALDDYWRLQPILEGVAAFMAHISDKKKGDKFGVPTWAVLPVAEAPVAALAGPLRTWVDVVALALDNDNLTGSERSFLYQRIKADRNDPAFAHAFAPIIERLQHKM